MNKLYTIVKTVSTIHLKNFSLHLKNSATPLLLRRPAPARPMSYRSKNLITRNLDCILYIPKIPDL